jgi:membrane fusion protein, multidrug efflux system
MRRLACWCTAVLVVVVASGCAGEEAEPAPIRAVNAVRVSFDAQASEIAYSGEVKPRYETALGFRLGGKIVERLVDVGDVVPADRVLARLDPEDQQLNSQAVRSRLAAADASYKQAKGDLERYTDLYEKRFIGRAEFDRRRTDYEVAQAQLAQVRAELAVTENQANYTRLRADHAGVVTSIEAEVGQVVVAGQTVLRIARTSEKEVAISVPERKLRELGSASDIVITLWANPDKKFAGTVREISPVADPVTRTYAVRVAMSGADSSVNLGMTANVYLKEVLGVRSVRLPATAIFQQGEVAAVWRIDPASNSVNAVPVQVIRYFEDKVAVTGELSDGDMIVRAGVHKLFEGETVRVLDGTGP